MRLAESRVQDRADLEDDAGPARAAAAGKRRFWISRPPVFIVDHTACILCERCSRACGEVKNNNVIGRTGKGATAGISFDLNDAMGESSACNAANAWCRARRRRSRLSPWRKSKRRRASEPLKFFDDMGVAMWEARYRGDNGIKRQHEQFDPRRSASVPGPGEKAVDRKLKPYSNGTGVDCRSDVSQHPPKFLLWQEGLALRRLVKKGDFLCREGDPGNTAYLIKSGRLQIILKENPNLIITSGVDDIVVGEMACLSGKPRKASVKAYTDCEIWEIRRNVLDRLMRSPDLQGAI